MCSIIIQLYNRQRTRHQVLTMNINLAHYMSHMLCMWLVGYHAAVISHHLVTTELQQTTRNSKINLLGIVIPAMYGIPEPRLLQNNVQQ